MWNPASRCCFLLSVVCFVLFSTCAMAQTGTSSVRGAILDKSGASVAGASIQLTDNELGIERTAISDNSGTYEFLSLQPGRYSLKVQAAGFRPYEQKNIDRKSVV